VRYGYAKYPADSTTKMVNPKDQQASLKLLAELAQRASVTPLVRNTAVKIIRNCKSRGDQCELEAVFRTVKTGDAGVAPFADGFKYIADPRYADYFESPVDAIENCLRGACGSDCDGHAGLIVALCSALGFKCGLRAWGRNKEGFSHVYAVVAFPKRPPFKDVVGMDTTVPESSVGWEPPQGEVLTAWLE
jgi:hypothetical protein